MAVGPHRNLRGQSGLRDGRPSPVSTARHPKQPDHADQRQQLGHSGNSDSSPALSADGRYVASAPLRTTWCRATPTAARTSSSTTRRPLPIERISVSGRGAQADSWSGGPAISSDGATSLSSPMPTTWCPATRTPRADIFLRDRQTGTTTRVSVSSAGAQGNGGSRQATISGDGRYVGFASDAGNLVASDTNGVADVFVRDTADQHDPSAQYGVRWYTSEWRQQRTQPFMKGATLCLSRTPLTSWRVIPTISRTYL